MPSPAPRSPRPGSCSAALRRFLVAAGAAGLLLAGASPALPASPPEQAEPLVARLIRHHPESPVGPQLRQLLERVARDGNRR